MQHRRNAMGRWVEGALAPVAAGPRGRSSPSQLGRGGLRQSSDMHGCPVDMLRTTPSTRAVLRIQRTSEKTFRPPEWSADVHGDSEIASSHYAFLRPLRLGVCGEF